jgi:putative glutamine amidotransferase
VIRAVQPVIGLSTYRQDARWGPWSEAADLLPATYAQAVAVAGGIPVLLPSPFAPVSPRSPVADSGGRAAEQAECVLARLDGLIISGGSDLDPARFGARRNPRTGPADHERDEWELALVHAAARSSLAVLGICRGMQVLNVAKGGTLVQHLPDAVGHDGHLPSIGRHARHDVRLDPTSRLGRLLGPSCSTATYHHQAVDAVGHGLVATGWALDGTVEAVEDSSSPWTVGVQWHPEAFEGRSLFEALVGACSAQMSGHGR